MEKKIHQLRTFFRVTNAAFNFGMEMRAALGGKPVVSTMHHLHKMALEEIERENPDLLIINKYLEQMTLMAEVTNSQPIPNFSKGGQ